VITIDSHPPQSLTTVTIDLAQLPRLSLASRLALRLSLALISRVEWRATHEEQRRARFEHLARSERERLTERLLLTTMSRR
jgi:hypothetical protein